MPTTTEDKDAFAGDEQLKDGVDKAASTPNGDTENTETVADGVAELQRKLDDSERARVSAERRADEAFRRAGHAENTAYGSQMAVLQGALDTLIANRETLKKDYAAALAAGEFDRAADLQTRIADEAAQKVEIEKGKAALEGQARPRQAPGDNEKVEAYVRSLQPRAAAWIRAHPQYVTDAQLNDELMEKHFAARRAGHAEGSDSYFTFMESNLGLAGGSGTAARPQQREQEQETNGENLSGASQVAQRRDVQPSPAAPSRGGSSRQIRLSPREAEAARISGLTDEEYAKNMERERRAGTIGKDRVH